MRTLKNYVRLIGNAGINPQISSYGDDKKVAKFTLATNDYYKNEDGEKQTITEWHDIVAFGKTAEIVEKYVKKGDELSIEGKLKYSYNEKNGVKTKYMSIVIEDFLNHSL